MLSQTSCYITGPLLLQLNCNSIRGVALELPEVVYPSRFGDVVEGLEEEHLLVLRPHIGDDGEDFRPRQARLEAEGGEGVSI